MSKKVLVISSILSSGGNSETLADEFIRGAIVGHPALQKAYELGKAITIEV